MNESIGGNVADNYYVTTKYALDSIRSIQNQHRHQCPVD